MAMSRNVQRGNAEKFRAAVDENSAVVEAFRLYQKLLDLRHDKHERIVKLSRDITIESKRVIFLLQRCAGEIQEEKQSVLMKAEGKLRAIRQAKFFPLALELDGEDAYQFLKAYFPGLQEYIEAMSFYHFLKTHQLITLNAVEKDLIFPRNGKTGDLTLISLGSGSQGETQVHINTCVDMEGGDELIDCSLTEPTVTHCISHDSDGSDLVKVTVPPVEFMMGIADLTGELMRSAIMSVSAGNIDFPVQVCYFMRTIHNAFASYVNTAPELNRKMWTLKQSLEKVENACYTLKVRGSEIPKHMLSSIFTSSSPNNITDDIHECVSE